MIAIDNFLPTSAPLHLEFVGGSYAPTPQPLPCQTLIKSRKKKTLVFESTTNKKFKTKKRVEVEIGDSDDELCGNKRRLGRLAKNKGIFKQMARCSQEDEEEDTNSEDSDNSLGDDKEKLKEDTDNKEEKWDDIVDGT